jgi:tRNA pseudouridine55 synthase
MDGFLNIDKAAGWTSHDVVAKVRSLLKISKVGHAGTLDPQATGVLPLCLGKATKLSEFLLHTDKKYRVVMKLGVTTDTQDADGRVLMRSETAAINRAAVEKVLKAFVGRIQQVPPMYSAVKIKGQPLYKMARRGQVVERAARDVTIYSLDILEMNESEVTFDVVCSRGTYIRTLCADAGERLGVGAHCLRLERRRCGPFCIEESVTLEEFESALAEEKHHRLVYDFSKVLGHLPELVVRSERAERVLHGVPLGYPDIHWPVVPFKKGDLFRVAMPDMGLVALVKALADSLNLQTQRPHAPLFKVEKVLVEELKFKSRDCTAV